MKNIRVISSSDVLEMNRKICLVEGNPHHCFSIGKIESALHSTFYPGEPPFIHGGIAKVAGAMAFYVTNAHAFQDGNKRTALVASSAFMLFNGWRLKYPGDSVADIILAASSGECDIDSVKDWFESHKVPT